MEEFELAYESQMNAHEILAAAGAFDELRGAVLQHCHETAPTPPYKPQRIKELLKPSGWLPEVRVPPMNMAYDGLPVNDRYDLWKDFRVADASIGIGIEIERWEVWSDLLKFRRGFTRGQIGAAIVLHDHPANLRYVFNHLRLMAEPLFADIPILFAAPSGGGLPHADAPTQRRYSPYLMPGLPR